MKMAMLYGWATYSVFGFEHTYVTSSDGYVWKCWGKSAGGQPICSGEGDSLQADCLSQKNSHAGIIYGVTGVCHQTANRVLLPAQCIVSKAQKYWVTVMVYGTYGTKRFNSLAELRSRIARCYQGAVPPELQVSGAESPGDAGIAQGGDDKLYLKRLNLMYRDFLESFKDSETRRGKEGDAGLLNRELEIMVEYRLGAETDIREVHSMRRLQDELLREKELYDDALLRKFLKPRHYANKVNDLVSETCNRIRGVVGEEKFQKIFGLSPDASFEIVDPEIIAYHQ